MWATHPPGVHPALGNEVVGDTLGRPGQFGQPRVDLLVQEADPFSEQPTFLLWQSCDDSENIH